MSQARYVLVFEGGIRPGFEREEVMQGFGRLFGLGEADVERIFAHARVVLKKRLDQAAAQAYVSRLASLGMVVRAEAEMEGATAAPPPGRVPASPPAPAVAAAVTAKPAAVPTPGAASHADNAEDVRVLGFEFSGQGTEFFRIWIVNLLLSILTLGVYSAWAKVRTQRYFYGNTRLDGSSFEYLAEPLSILKGRLVAFALLLLYLFADQFMPLLGAVLVLAFFVIFPWVMVRGLAFRNQNSAWRAVRFGFDGRLGEAYKVFLLWPLLGVLTLGLLFPYAVCRQQRYIIGNSRYGRSHFEFGAGPGGFYRIALVVAGVGLAGFLLSVLMGLVFAPLSALLMLAVYLAVFAVANVMFVNLRYNNTLIALHGLQADYQVASYAMLVLTNLLGIVLTLGLFYPWAKVRTARYAAGHVSLAAVGDLGAFAAQQQQAVSALGGEIGDVFDVDLGI